MDKVTKEDHII